MTKPEVSHFEKSFFGKDFISNWEMTYYERLAFLALVQTIRPTLALEIGSRGGGSLQVLSQYCGHVISLDIDESIGTRLKNQFPSVEFRVGDSKIELPKLLKELEKKNQLPDFIFVDGDHSSEGARSDTHHVLSIKPQKRTWVIVHDIFNPLVRAGVEACTLSDYPYLHFANIDFAPGILFNSGPLNGEKWNGFALFILEPFLRKGEIDYQEAWWQATSGTYQFCTVND